MIKKFKIQKKAVGGEITPLKRDLKNDVTVQVLAKAPTYNELSDKFGNFDLTDPIKRKALKDAWDREHPKKKEARSQMPERSFAEGGPILDYENIEEQKGLGEAIAGASIAGAEGALTGSAVPGLGTIAGAAIGVVGSLTKDLIGSQKTRRKNQLAIANNQHRDLQLATQGFSKGGEIEGEGTGKSDSIKASLDAGDFIVPIENKDKAKAIRSEYFGEDEDETANTQDGDTPVKVSNGEVRFTKPEMDYLDQIGKGDEVRGLAPHAKKGNKKASGGPVDEPDDMYTAEQNMLGVKKTKDNLDGNIIDRTPDGKPIYKKGFKSQKTPSKIAALAKNNTGLIAGASQALAGIIEASRNAREERNLKPVMSQGAIYNTEALKVKQAADEAASAIIAGNEAESDKRMGNVVKMASEQGSNAAVNLATMAKVGDSTDAYLKGITVAAQTRLAGQQSASEIKIKGAQDSAQTNMYNDEQKRKLLGIKSENANNLITTGIGNVVGSSLRKNYTDKMAALDASKKNNLSYTPGMKSGGPVKKFKKIKS